MQQFLQHFNILSKCNNSYSISLFYQNITILTAFQYFIKMQQFLQHFNILSKCNNSYSISIFYQNVTILTVFQQLKGYKTKVEYLISQFNQQSTFGSQFYVDSH